MTEQVSWYGAGGRFRNKIYVGNLSSRTRESDIKEAFNKYGDVADIVLKYDFAFVEMENEKDMEEAIDALDGNECHGRSWLVEPARRGPSRLSSSHNTSSYLYQNKNKNNDYYERNRTPNKTPKAMTGGAGDSHRRPAGMRPIRGEYRIQILGLSSATSWQDLKDWGRTAGESVCYGDVFVDCGRRMGIVEYSLRDDYLYALKHLNGDKLHGKELTVYKDGDAPPINAEIHNDSDKMMDDSLSSPPRLHENQRHITRRSYYGGSRAYGSSSNHHKKDINGHRERRRSRRHRHHERSRSISSLRSRTPSPSRSRSRSRHKRRERGHHRERRRSRRSRHHHHHHRRRRGRHHRSRSTDSKSLSKSMDNDDEITTKTHLSNSKVNGGDNNDVNMGHIEVNGGDGKHNVKQRSRTRSVSKSKSQSHSKSRSPST